MIVAVLLLLFLGAPPMPAQPEQPAAENASRILLPDITLSAEDPLYLQPPPPVGWRLVPPAQPPYVRLRLFAVNFPPRIRAEPVLALIPDSAPRAAPRPVPRSARQPARAAASSEAGRKPSQLPLPEAGQAAPVPLRPACAAGLAVAYLSPATASADLWADRRSGAWTLSGNGAFALSEDVPWYASASLSAERLDGAWSGSLAVSGALAPRTDLATGASLAADLSVQGRAVRAGSRMVLFMERMPPDPAPVALGEERLSLDWQGSAWGAYASAQVLLGSSLEAFELRAQGLVRAGLRWGGGPRPLQLSAGAALLFFPAEPKLYPEALAEYRPWPVLRLTAGFAPFLSEPEPFLVRAVFGAGSLPAVPVQGGISARFAALLDVPEGLSIEAVCEARAGELHQVRKGELVLAESREIGASADLAWRLLDGAARRTQITVTTKAAAALPLPVPEPWLDHLRDRFLSAGLHVVFSGVPAEIILKAHWGDFTAAELPALLAAGSSAAAGWAASLELRWNVRPGFTVGGGVEMREPLLLRALAGFRLQRQNKDR